MHISKSRAALAALAAAAALGACGGGGGGGGTPAPAPSSDIPASAQSSIDGLLAYVNQLIGGSSDSSEPVKVGDAVLPVSDTALPN